MDLRYAGKCSMCGEEIPQRARAIYNSAARNVRHIDCSSRIDRGVAGASARLEHERRSVKDEARIAAQKANLQAKYGTGFVSKVAIFLSVDDRPRSSAEVWAQGAVGEERVAEWLDRLAEVGVTTLHDRRIPGSRGNFDHIAISPWGVWVIDAKRYVNKRPALSVEGGFFGLGGTERLTVGGRKKDVLVDGVLRQIDHVKTVVGDAAPVHGALAFVDADWPLIGGHFTVRGVSVVWPKRLAKTILREAPPTVDVEAVSKLLAAHFPPA